MQKSLTTIEPTTALATRTEERGAIGAAILVWLLGGGLGLAVLVFIFAKAC